MKKQNFLLFTIVISFLVTVLTLTLWENMHKIKWSKIVNIASNKTNRSISIKQDNSSKENISIKIEISPEINIVKYQPNKFEKNYLLIGGKTIDIFIHGGHDLISSDIIRNHMWEGQWINSLITYIRNHPGIQLIDLGCNLGVYSLVAAAFGCQVLAVDANRNNTDRLMQSINANRFNDSITVISNALSNVRKEFSMITVNSNIGGQYLSENGKMFYKVKSIFMDDLVPLLTKDKEVIMKIDIEGSEINALKKASKLFSHVNITAILMEWNIVKLNLESYTLMHFLLNRNYSAYNGFFSEAVLDISNYKAWPYDIVWRKMK